MTATDTPTVHRCTSGTCQAAGTITVHVLGAVRWSCRRHAATIRRSFRAATRGATR